MKRSFDVELSGRRELSTLTHELTHRRYRFTVLSGSAPARATDVESRYEALRWVDVSELATLGLAAWSTRLLSNQYVPPARKKPTNQA